jgi:hypothetical protein
LDEIPFVEVERELAETLATASALLTADPFRTVLLGRVGELAIVRDESVESLTFEGHGAELDPNLEGRRLRRATLSKAVQQLTESRWPGVIVLDAKLNSLARNSVEYMKGWVAKQERLAALLFIERQFFDGRMFAAAGVLPGPQFTHAAPLMCGFQLCNLGHIHYPGVCGLPAECPCGNWFDAFG